MATTLLEYRLDPDELTDAKMQHLRSMPANIRALRVFWLVLATSILAVALAFSTLMLVPFALSLLGVCTVRWQMRRATRRMIQKTPALTEAMTLTFDDEGVQIETALSRLWYAWRNYESVVSSPAGVGLVTRGGVVLRWVPARGFPSDQDRAAFEATARTGLAGR